MVVNEYAQLVSDTTQIFNLLPRFADFDLEGKRIFADKLDDLGERFQIFFTRCKLSEEPGVKQWMHQLNVQFLEAGMSPEAFYKTQLADQARTLRFFIENEQKYQNQPEVLRSLREQLKAGLPKEDIPDLTEWLSDPALEPALQDPQALAAVKDVVSNPSNAYKYMDNPRLRGLIEKLVEWSKH